MVRVIGFTMLTVLALPLPAEAQPSGPHPRIWWRPDVVAAWESAADEPTSAVARAIAKCDDAQANPSEFADGQYQGFVWVEMLGACLVAYATTDSVEHRDTAILYWWALLNDRDTIDDGLGPQYNGGVGIVSQDTGYSMRTHGVWAALGYDWLYEALSQGQRDVAHERFVQWLAFHHQPDTYQRAQPGANYHAGHVLAVTLLAIGHGHEMNAYDAGTGSALFGYVTDSMWGQVMADGVAARGPLRGGDWLEGWQYAPLSVASYSLAGRALVEQGVQIDWLASWNAETLYRFVHGLSPDDRMFVGGDTDDESPTLDFNPLPLLGVIAGQASEEVRGFAAAELERVGNPGFDDFRLFFEALAEAEQVEPQALDRTTLPTAFLAEGSGNFYARTSFASDASWLVSQCKGIIVDHQHQDAGNLTLQRGADALLVDPSPYGSLSTLTGNAPTLEQPHFNAEYQPSQGAFGESYSEVPVADDQHTRFVFARATASNVAVTRCDWSAQLRFRDEASAIVSGARRDIVLLPGASGASVLVADRVRTTSAFASIPNPLLLRFRSLGSFQESGGGASAVATVGTSQLSIRRIVGSATTAAVASPLGSCGASDRGKCADARFEAYEWSAQVEGPDPEAWHLLDADATGADASAVAVDEIGSVRAVTIDREARRFVIVAATDASVVSSYATPNVASTQIVLDAPTGDFVRVTASLSSDGSRCEVSLELGQAGDGFSNAPLVFALDPTCAAIEDVAQPSNLPEAGGGVGGDGGASGSTAGAGASNSASGAGSTAGNGPLGDGGPAATGADASVRSGCGCSAPGRTRPPWGLGGLAALLLAATWARSRVRRRVLRGLSSGRVCTENATAKALGRDSALFGAGG